VTYRPIARKRFGKRIRTEAYERNNRTSIARQRISKQALSTIERLYSLRGPCRGAIKGQRMSFELFFELFTRVEVGSNTSTVTLRVVGGDEKGSLKSERVKYGRESRGTRTPERLR
jgi:hypothetical protein